MNENNGLIKVENLSVKQKKILKKILWPHAVKELKIGLFTKLVSKNYC